jgi:hypothetical protein
VDSMTLTGPNDTRVETPKHDYHRLEVRPSRPKKKTQMVLSRTGGNASSPPERVHVTQNGTLKVKARTQAAERSFAASTSAQHVETAVRRMVTEKAGVTQVSIPTDLSAAEMVSRVISGSQSGKIAPQEVVDLLFPFLFTGTLYERRQVYAALRERGTPQAILETGLRTYRTEGYEGFLNDAVSLLADFKASAWPVLRKWAKSGEAECEPLVRVVFAVEGIPEGERLKALQDLSRNPDESTRRRVLEMLHQVPPSARREILLTLRDGNRPGDPVQSEAAELLNDENG